MKIALAQMNPTVGDIRGNASRTLDLVDRARREGAEVAVFPELAVTGYPPRDLLYVDEFVEDAIEATMVIAREARGIDVVLGTVDRPPGWRPVDHVRRAFSGARPPCRNVAAVLREGRVAAVQAKTLLAVTDVFHEARYFEPAASTRPIELGGRSAGVLICEDLWDEEYPRHPPRDLLAAGAELLISISASPFREGVLAHRLRHARRPKAPLVYLNAVGGQDELIFCGGSFVLGAAGRIVAALPRFEEAFRIVDLDRPPAEPEPPPEPPRAEALYRALVLGVRDFVRKNRLDRAFLGLSGGVDSSLVACIAADALGPEHVTALALPSRFSDPRSTDEARVLALRLGIGFEVVPIEPLHEAAERAFRPLFAGEPFGVPAENVQARLRGIILMAYVNRRGGILLNTSNKTELTFGYGTLYGDMAGGLGVISDLTKPDIYDLARWVNRDREVIPRFVIERVPTAELKPDQVDPFDYPRISPIAEAAVHYATIDELRALGATRDDIAYVDRLLRASEHKRWQSPVGLKVKPISFGTGRLMPVTQRYDRLWGR